MNTPAPFTAVDVSWNRFQENALLLRASAGSCRIKLGPNFPGGDTSPTGLANDATVYTATVVYNGATEAVSIVGSAAQTIGALLTELNADLTPAVTLDGDEIVITSATTGAASSVFVSDTGTNFLFASLRGDRDPATASVEHYGVTNYDSTRGWFAIAGSANRVGTSVRGNNFYLRTDKMDGGHQEQLAAVIDAFLAGGVANTNQPWVNAAAAIAITGGLPTPNTASELSRATVYQLQLNVNGDGNVTVFVDLNIPQTSGAPFEQVVAALNAGIAAARRSDGSALPVVAEWQQGVSVTTQPSAIVFRVLDSNELFSATSAGALEHGAGSSLVLTDGLANGLVAAITATATWTGAIDAAQGGSAVVSFNRVNAAAVAPATVPAVTNGNYDFTVSVDGASYNVTVAVTNADTMTVIAGAMQTALQTATGSTETVEAVGNSFVITSATTGFAADVFVTIPTAGANPDLFNAIAAALDVVDPRGDTSVSTRAVEGFATPGVDGATNLVFPKTVDSIAYADWLAVLDTAQVGGRISGQYIHGVTGYGPIFTSASAQAFEKELRPQALGQCVNRSVYWDGAAWRYFVAGDASRLNTDDTSAGTNNPPSTLASGI